MSQNNRPTGPNRSEWTTGKRISGAMALMSSADHPSSVFGPRPRGLDSFAVSLFTNSEFVNNETAMLSRSIKYLCAVMVISARAMSAVPLIT